MPTPTPEWQDGDTMPEPTEQIGLFDPVAARRGKRNGMARVAARNAEFLRVAREIAVEIAHREGDVTADDVRARCEEIGLEPTHFNCWGSVMKGEPRLRWTGRWTTSARVCGHANPIRVWEIA